MQSNETSKTTAAETLRKLVEWPAILCGFMLIAAAILVSAEVLLRKFFSYSIGGADELSSYVLAITTAWGFSLAVVHRAHIRIDVLYQSLSSKLRALLDIFAMLSISLFAGYLSFYCWNVIGKTLQRGSTANTPLQTPLWMPQGIWFAGLLVFSFVTLYLLVRSILLFARKDYAGVSLIAGVRSSNEELSEALETSSKLHGTASNLQTGKSE
jgi:TRAP-type C4-dicarboxylate transport system permease small subunit